MKIKPIQFILTAIILIAVDVVYLKLIAPFYNLQVKKIQGNEINFRMYSAVIVYIILITGIYYFIIGPNKSVKEGTFFGLVVYGVFNFTNHAVLDNFSLPLAMMDSIWGMVLCGTTTFLMTKIF